MSTATAVRERPIIFSAFMLRAILAGQKTQTRRIVKPQPHAWEGGEGSFIWKNWINKQLTQTEDLITGHTTSEERTIPISEFILKWCPYGLTGDLLWVREKCALWTYEDGTNGGLHPVVYGSDDAEWEQIQREAKSLKREGYPRDGIGAWKICSPIHMPRWASRITLEITDVRVERVRDITEADVLAEGLCADHSGPRKPCFAWLWDDINGAGSWDANPFVWIIEFRKAGASC